jgi:hypothetical protein
MRNFPKMLMVTESTHHHMNKSRYALYHAFTYACYGHIEKNNHIKLGKCVEEKIKELFPNPDGEEYTGFLPADEYVIE